jgi:hypothetical protein
MTDELDFYATPGPMTDLAGRDEALAGMPTDPAGVTAVVHGLILHGYMTENYGVPMPEPGTGDVQIRGTGAMVDRLLALDPRPLVEPRDPGHRFLGNCRHFSTLTVALLRRAGVPSRARCGFAGYFQAGKWVDHWIVEHWDGTRWVSLDAQIDQFQRDAFGLTADPADLPAGMFLPAGDAWQRCRAGEADPDDFGILDMWGAWFIRGNIPRDLAALNKVEMLPWDWWGEVGFDEPPPGGDAYVDDIAAVAGSGDFDAIRSRYVNDASLTVPSRVTVGFTPTGPTDVDVIELS